MKTYTYLLLIALFLGSCQSKKPKQASMHITWELIDNLVNEKDQSLWQISISNQLGQSLSNNGWKLYFNHIIALETNYESGLVINHVNGDLRVIEPTLDFIPLKTGKRFSFKVWSNASVLNFTDAPMGFYLVQDSNPDIAIACSLEIRPIESKNLKRTENEELAIYDAIQAFDENTQTFELKKGEYCPIIPTPSVYTSKKGTYNLNSNINIAYDAKFEQEANFIEQKLSSLFNGTLTMDSKHEPNIRIQHTTTIESKEAYKLSINEQGVLIKANGSAGAFYGAQSFLALITIDAWEKPQNELSLNYVFIQDEPRFAYRGIFMDVARNFQPKENILKLLDAMAFYKLNKFHFHICDDEGWRVEINDLPELTEFGAFRGYSENESKYLYPSFGSGPNPEPSQSHGSGFYTREEFIDILRYANERHIEIIPEIDMPGHARAAIRSMQVRYDKHMALGDKEKANEYLLQDPNDVSEYTSVQGWKDNVIDVSMESSYHFLEKITDEFMLMFKEAGAPLTSIHTGGDEVPHGVWTNSPSCDQFMAANLKYNNPVDMAQYFVYRFSELLAKRNLIAAGWEEIALLHENEVKPNPAFVGKNLLPFVWNNMWNSGAEDIGYQLANAGYPVVLAHVTNFYFDLAYNKNPEEPGYYWGNFIDTKSPWEYTPFDISKCAEEDRFGHTINRKDIQNNTLKLSSKGALNIQGIQGLLWSENNLGAERMEYFFFPKMLGLAERAWAKQPNWASIEDNTKRKEEKAQAWNEFTNTVGHYDLPRLDYMNGGYRYRIPPPGVKIMDRKVHANTLFPGLNIFTSKGRTDPTIKSDLYQSELEVAEELKFKIFTKNNRGSRTIRY